MDRILRVVIAGEVDAGKSTLIGRLLYDTGSLHNTAISEILQASSSHGSGLEFAYLLDGLEEEREGQLTIDTTQIFCRNTKSGFWFIDVPGHAELLRNMLCGSSYAQAAILVIDATKPLGNGAIRHINVLNFLGIKQIVVVINKLDMLNFDKNAFERAKGETLGFLESIGMKAGYFIPLSACQGDNIVKKSARTIWYKGQCLISALCFLERLHKTERKEGFYFPIQDVYMHQAGQVFVGTILSGKIKKNDLVYVSAQGKQNRVKAIRVFGKNKLSALAPQSIGLELVKKDRLVRGQIIYKDSELLISSEITAKILCVQPIIPGERPFFNCATQQVPCCIKQVIKHFSISTGAISEHEDCLDKQNLAEVFIMLQEKVAVKRFAQLQALGRFVLKRDRGIVAAGVIV
jgi:sulfate adenylyltransferase subunit 1 (EFTu-like GTPase family)